jgi:HEAT repeat protein
MRKRLQIALAVFLVALAGVIAWQVRPPRVAEPGYHERSLHHWLQEYYWSRSTVSRHALQHIGTNAIPTLLSMLSEKDFYAKSNLTQRLLADLSPMRIISARSFTDRARITVEESLLQQVRKNPAYEHNIEAALGFRVLEADSRPAVPGLIKIYEQNISLESRLATCDAIMSIGPPAGAAVPCLLRGVDDSNEFVRLAAIAALWHIHAEPSLVVPVLIKALGDRKSDVREVAIWALAWFGTKAATAVSALEPLLNDPNEDVRNAATNALKSIDPVAAARSGVL